MCSLHQGVAPVVLVLAYPRYSYDYTCQEGDVSTLWPAFLPLM